MTDSKQPDSEHPSEAPDEAELEENIAPGGDHIDPDMVSADDDEPEADSEPESDPETNPGPAATPVVVAKPRGRVLATFAFLFALSAAAGVGYLYYLLIYLQPIADVRAQNSALGVQYVELESRLSNQMDDLRQASRVALEEANAGQAKRLASNEKAVLKSLSEALLAAPPSQREWKLAEAEYLLRIANHRVLMEQDSIGALSLLQAVDEILAELDDFALYQVRARLADEIIALRQVPRDDTQGVYLRIEALKSQLDELPLPEPAYLRNAATVEPDHSVWQTLLDELKKFITVRTLNSDEALRPLLAPEQQRYLELNLRLALEQAQLATLKRQQVVYQQSLQTVRRWLVDHADPDARRTQTLLQNIDELMLIELARGLPEISGSLNELLSIRRGGA